MKILLITPQPPGGGISTFAGYLIDYLRSNPDGNSVVLCNASDKMRSIVSESTIVRIYTGIINSLRIYFEVKKIIKKEKPDIIYLTSSSSLALLKDQLIINHAKRLKIPLVVHWHFGRIPALATQNNWEWKLLCSAISKTTRSIVIDNKSFVTLKSAGFSNVLYIPNPVGSDFEQKSRELYESGTQKVPGRLIFVGQLIRRKGIYELVEACSQLASIKELILIGPYQKLTGNELLEIAKKRNNGDWLNLTGSLSRNAVLEYMQSSPILVLPSYTEGFPNVVVEAMSMGCAVIATDVGAIPDMLAVTTDSPCGICVPVHDTEELMKAILNLIQDPAKTEVLGKNGIKRILNNYTLSKIVQEYRSVWKESTLEGSSFTSR